jgi:orotidine-5'-phosphate decarboxylase
MKSFSDRLCEEVRSKKTVLVVGIDPRPDVLPASLIERYTKKANTETKQEENPAKVNARIIYYALRRFCFDIIDSTADLACAVKIQVAFFEQLGPAGWRHCADIIKYAHNKGLIVIADAKRGDIGTTSDAYAKAWFGDTTPAGTDNLLKSDSLTVAPYLGKDTIASFNPYIEMGAGIFVLCRTSNPSAVDVQDLKAGHECVWEHVARLISKLGDKYIGQYGLSSIGAVVGATYPEEGIIARKIAPHAWFLVPGVGAQGGKPEDARSFTRRDGLGAVFNVSRGIMYAYKEKDYKELGDANFAEAARQAASYYKDALWDACSIKE